MSFFLLLLLNLPSECYSYTYSLLWLKLQLEEKRESYQRVCSMSNMHFSFYTELKAAFQDYCTLNFISFWTSPQSYLWTLVVLVGLTMILCFPCPSRWIFECCLPLCSVYMQIVSQAPQHFTSSEVRSTVEPMIKDHYDERPIYKTAFSETFACIFLCKWTHD